MKTTRRTKAWLATRRKWLKDNPPNHAGYYVCAMCQYWIPAAEITLDHIVPRSRRPDLVNDLSNLQPLCAPCNMLKGSRVA